MRRAKLNLKVPFSGISDFETESAAGHSRKRNELRTKVGAKMKLEAHNSGATRN